jgi:hypothetical protein
MQQSTGSPRKTYREHPAIVAASRPTSVKAIKSKKTAKKEPNGAPACLSAASRREALSQRTISGGPRSVPLSAQADRLLGFARPHKFMHGRTESLLMTCSMEQASLSAIWVNLQNVG